MKLCFEDGTEYSDRKFISKIWNDARYCRAFYIEYVFFGDSYNVAFVFLCKDWNKAVRLHRLTKQEMTDFDCLKEIQREFDIVTHNFAHLDTDWCLRTDSGKRIFPMKYRSKYVREHNGQISPNFVV